MSRGHGWVEREILDLLSINRTMTAPVLAAVIYQEGPDPTPAQRTSVRRALRNLRKAGKVVKLGGMFRGERCSYVSRQTAAEIAARSVKAFGLASLRDHPELIDVYVEPEADQA